MQMLLDTYFLKKGFSELLTLTAPSSTPPPPNYVKRVSQSMARLDPILKTLQVRPSPPEALVQAYLIHIADKSDANFRKILELKGIRKQDHPHLLELFHAHRASPRNAALSQSSPLLTPLIVHQSAGGVPGAALASGLGSQLSSAAVVSTANLQARFDPATFGNAIMSAARDGVDRFGSPALSNNPSGVATPASHHQQQQSSGGPDTPNPNPSVIGAITSTGGGSVPANLNENLRNIGKFFKRDIGSFSGRFGGAKGASEDS